MNVAKQLANANEYLNLWQVLMPSQSPPGFDQFAMWAGSHTSDHVVRGINRAAGKSRKLRDTDTPMTTGDIVRYASSVMRHESLGERKFDRPAYAGNIAA